MELSERHLDLLKILGENGKGGLTSHDVMEYANIKGTFDIPNDVYIVSSLAQELREKFRYVQKSGAKHYLTKLGEKFLKEHQENNPESALPIPEENLVDPFVNESDLEPAKISPNLMILERDGPYKAIVDLINNHQKLLGSIQVSGKDKKIDVLQSVIAFVHPKIGEVLKEMVSDYERFEEAE